MATHGAEQRARQHDAPQRCVGWEPEDRLGKKPGGLRALITRSVAVVAYEWRRVTLNVVYFPKFRDINLTNQLGFWLTIWP